MVARKLVKSPNKRTLKASVGTSRKAQAIDNKAKPHGPPTTGMSERANDTSVRKTTPARISAIAGVSANVKILEFEPGLYSLNFGASVVTGDGLSGTPLPATQITGSPIGRIEVFSAARQIAWLGPEGGTVVVRIPSEGGHLWITTYRHANHQVPPIEIQVTRLDQPHQSGQAQSSPPPQSATGSGEGKQESSTRLTTEEIRLEISVHLERLGDRTFPAGQWIGNRGQRRRIEAFAIRPLEAISSQDIEYKAFGPNGRETPWVTDAKLCGTRGQGIPLTGFAIRLASHLRERYDVTYEGSFFDGGISGPVSNGRTCKSTRLDDPLEDVDIHLVLRS